MSPTTTTTPNSSTARGTQKSLNFTLCAGASLGCLLVEKKRKMLPRAFAVLPILLSVVAAELHLGTGIYDATGPFTDVLM